MKAIIKALSKKRSDSSRCVFQTWRVKTGRSDTMMLQQSGAHIEIEFQDRQ